MFYQGDLQGGIAAAIRESKSVVCFVRDDEDESLIWENEFLRDPSLGDLLVHKAIILRLEANSQEAGFLAALYPLPKTPTLVVIQSGQLKEYLVSGNSKEDFIRRLKAALEQTSASVEIHGNSPAAAPSSSSTNEPESILDNSTSRTSTQSREVQLLLEERRIRMEANQKAQEDKEKSEREEGAAAKDLDPESAKSLPDPKKSSDRKYALLQRKRQQDARDERARILKRVEDDKIERREKEALRREQVRAIVAGEIADEASTVPVTNLRQAASTRSAECAVQVRLFDGSTIRSRFPSGNTLRTHVRTWVDEQRKDADDGDLPYTFKQILTPLPNRTISISEEEESLQILGLCPSVTMILVPVKEFTSAYESNGSVGIVSRGVSASVGIVSSGLGLVTGALGSLLWSGTAEPTQSDNSTADFQSRSTNVNIQSSRDRRDAPEEHQLYNGNNLNFEPRRDHEDKKVD